ncbi:hypothetical protein JY651_07540 [Pyxidicoccus parkwayensis]|uniref:Lipoprotein n=1 Tax=Pyxidicoccus parkwayensis TaxID=2813578 RepID=A0ABX7P2V3_9BACT|nr:hypothetical protein [Pyxidicoccus parkwaysis]QSQ24786.1 hypothetical protein JY651_07540 [Pyxidicoccus parkwaysis]
MSELERRRRNQLWVLWGTTLFAFLVHPLGAVLSDLLFGTERVHELVMGGVEKTLARYGFATCFAAPPIVIYAVIAFVVGRAFKPRPYLDAAIRTGDIAFPLLALVAQLISWKELASDAQAALLFIFLPPYAALAASVLVVAVFLFGWIYSRMRASARGSA